MTEICPDLSTYKFNEVIEELGLVNDSINPYFLSPEGNIVLFRGQTKHQESLNLSFGDNAVYGQGSYLANVPSAVSAQAYGSVDRGVAVYELPFIESSQIDNRRITAGIGSSTASLILFPMPFLTRAVRIAYFKGRKQDGFMSPKWALLREGSENKHIQAARKIAWLGQTCIGIPRP